jgi:hypothetical protein
MIVLDLNRMNQGSRWESRDQRGLLIAPQVTSAELEIARLIPVFAGPAFDASTLLP